MWCYQKPGFEALLLAELQRQQQCSQFCDTLLKADDVSVPAHSCILSAISPHIFSTLSSTPAPPAGQSRLLDCQALGTCTLLHMVRLLYSGEISGVGEKEKQEAMSAAAKLGIHGLVEVTKRDRKSRNGEGDCQRTEMGVQTEELMPEESEARPSRWRREVRDGSTFLWKEMLSNAEKDSWTQTEELQVNTAPSYQSFETIDVTALQSLRQTDSHLVPPQIPYIPISLVYPPEPNQTPQPSSAPAASFQESPAAGSFLLPFSSQATPWAADPQSRWAGPQGADGDVMAGKELEEEQLEQFQDNIPEFINYFLNPDKVEEGPRRGRPQRRQGARVGGARRASTVERKARRPQAGTGGRGRGGLTQRVDVQDVGVSKLQKLFLQRWGVQACRPGQGGGAVGRKLYLKTREFLKKAKGCPRRRGAGKAWDFNQSGEFVPYSENTQRRSRTTTQEFKQVKNPVDRPRRATAKSATSVSFSSPPMPFYNVHTLPAPGPSLQSSLPPNLMLPAASYSFPASSLLHTTSLPPPSAPYVDQPEHFDRLLEEVIMGLDCSSSVNTFSQNKQQSHGSSDARGDGRSSCATGEVPILQQKAEGELTEMLDHFLQSFEQHVENCTAREEEEMGGDGTTEVSQPYTVQSKYSRTKIQMTAPHTPYPQRTHTARPAQVIRHPKETTQSRSQPRKLSSPKHTEGTPGRVRAKRPKRRKVQQYLFTLEKPKVRQRSDAKTKIVPDRGDKQLQQMPVVQLERSGPLPVNATLQRRSCQCLEVKSLTQTKNSSSSSVNSARVSLSEKNQLFSWSQKTYPIRSRFKEAQIMDSMPFLEQPLSDKRAPQPARRRGRPKKNRELHILSNKESPATLIPLQPLEPCDRDEQLESNQERREEELTVMPQEETTGRAGRGVKRGAEEERSNDTNVAKRVCLPSSESTDPVSEAAAETEDVIDVETVSLTSVGDTSQRKEQEEKTVWSEIKLGAADQNGEERESLMDEEMVSSGDEIIDVDGVSDGSIGLEREDDCREQAEKIRHNRTTLKEVSLGSTGSWEEDRDADIDVIGGCSPLPDPVIISLTEFSGGEEEEGDEEIVVTEEKTAVFTLSKGELVNRQYHPELRLH